MGRYFERNGAFALDRFRLDLMTEIRRCVERVFADELNPKRMKRVVSNEEFGLDGRCAVCEELGRAAYKVRTVHYQSSSSGIACLTDYL